MLLDPDLNGWRVPHGPKAEKWATVFAVLTIVFGGLGALVVAMFVFTLVA